MLQSPCLFIWSLASWTSIYLRFQAHIPELGLTSFLFAPQFGVLNICGAGERRPALAIGLSAAVQCCDALISELDRLSNLKYSLTRQHKIEELNDEIYHLPVHKNIFG